MPRKEAVINEFANPNEEFMYLQKSLDTIYDIIKVEGIDSIEVTAEKILVAAGDYAADEVMSESAADGTPFIFNGMAKGKLLTGRIVKSTIYVSVTDLTPRITLYLFNKYPTSALADNGGNTAVITGDKLNFVGQIDYPPLDNTGGGSTQMVSPSTVGGLPIYYTADAGGRLYGIAVTRDIIAGEAAGMNLIIKLQVERD